MSIWDNKFDFKAPPKIALPTIYDEALSYMELIYVLANRVEEVVALIEGLEDKSKEYTDEQIAIVREELLTQLNDTIATLNTNYQAFENLVNANLTLMSTEIRSFDQKITNDIIGVNARTDYAIAQNNKWLLAEIGKGFVDLKVINYFTGEAVSVQEMFDYLAQFHLANAITYDEIVAKHKTYNQLIALNATYTDLAMIGKTLIGG